MAKNPFGKTRKMDNPYAVYAGFGPFGKTECRVLKAYQTPDHEDTNPYAKWFVAVQSEWTYGSFDMGDSYVRDCRMGMSLVKCTKEWADAHPDWVNEDTEIVE